MLVVAVDKPTVNTNVPLPYTWYGLRISVSHAATISSEEFHKNHNRYNACRRNVCRRFVCCENVQHWLFSHSTELNVFDLGNAGQN